MTVINQTFTLNAVNGGTLTSSGQRASAVMLTNNRFVVVTNQTTPGGRVFSIVDNSAGLNDSSTPTFYNAVFSDTNTTMVSAGSVKMVRLNDTTFLLAWNPSNGTSWTFQVYTVSGTSITLKLTTSYTYGGNTSTNQNGANNLAFSNAQQSIAFVPLGDNTVMVNDNYTLQTGTSPYYNYPQEIICDQFYWNPTALTLTKIGSNTFNAQSEWTWGGSYQAYSGGIYGYFYQTPQNWYSQDVSYIPVGDGRVAQIFKGVLSTTLQTDGSNYSSFGMYIWAPPSTVGQVWTRSFQRLMPTSSDPCYQMSGGTPRLICAAWNYAYYYAAAESSAWPLPVNYLPSSGGSTFQVSAVGDPALSAPIVLPVSADFHAVIDRRHFYNPTNAFQMKIVRRDDHNIITPSTGSTGAYGFTVNVPKINVFWDKPRPIVLSNGDIMWWGLIGTKFAYNVIKQPSLPSS